MCDLSPVRNWLLGIIGCIVGAIGLLVAAAILQGSWWTAWASPILLGLAGAAAAAGAFMCGAAIGALNTYCACAGAGCTGACNNVRSVLTGMAAVLGIQATVCLAASLFGIGAGVVMYIVTGALIIQIALVITALAMLGALSSCMTTTPVPPPFMPPPIGMAGGGR